MVSISSRPRQFLLCFFAQLHQFILVTALYGMYNTDLYTAKERPVRIQYKCLVPIYVFSEMELLFPKQNYNKQSLSSFTRISVRDLQYIFPGSVCLFYCREIWGPILGIYKSLTDT